MSGAIRLPAEWEPQSAIMLTWPHDERHWQDGLARVERVFRDIVREVATHQDLLIVCKDDAHRQHVRTCLAGTDVPPQRLHLHIVASNDCWARDHGPIAVLKGDATLLMDFQFNGWGGKYPAALDNAITRTLAKTGAFATTPVQTCNWVLEGGSIDSDGLGTILTTRSCLLSGTRNPGRTRQEVEDALKRLLGVRRCLWLEHSTLAGDDTDGHIDMLARFVSADTIAYIGCGDPGDANHDSLRRLGEEIHNLRQVDGRPYHLIELPPPPPILDADGHRLPASYANFLITNNKVLLPVYAQATDSLALALLQEYFQDRQVIGIDCLPLIRQYGSLHCASMQIPAGISIHD